MTRGRRLRPRCARCVWCAGPGLVALAPTPALAHPLTGGPASPGQVAVTVAGLALVVLGAAGAWVAGKRPDRGGILRKLVGAPALLLGLVTVFVGPDVVLRIDSRCSQRPSTTATLDVTSPTDGERFPASAVPVRVEVVGGELAAPDVDRLVPGQGHLQVSVDGAVVVRAGAPAQVLQVRDGEHRVTVEYVAADHLPFCPRVSVTRTIRVRP